MNQTKARLNLLNLNKQWINKSSKLFLFIYSSTAFYNSCKVRFNSTASKRIVFHNHPTTTLAKMNAQLTDLIRSRKYSPKIALEKVMSVVEEMNIRNLRYDLNTYNALLTAYARVKDQKAISETLDRMEKEGIKPTIDTYNYIMKVRTFFYINI